MVGEWTVVGILCFFDCKQRAFFEVNAQIASAMLLAVQSEIEKLMKYNDVLLQGLYRYLSLDRFCICLTLQVKFMLVLHRC